MEDDTWWAELAVLTPAEVARLWTEERRRLDGSDAPDVKISTVWSYVKESRPMVGVKPGRFAGYPVPPPHIGGQRMSWAPARGQTMTDVVDALRSWWRERPRQPAPGQPVQEHVTHEGA